MGLTPLRSIPYPESTDAADVPADIKRVADKMDTFGYVPIGGVMIWPLAGVPDANWLPCNGSAVPAGYPLLSALMSNTPNLQGRVIVGVGSHTTGGTTYNYALGSTGGEEEHLLTIAEMPSHQHQYDDERPYRSGLQEMATGGNNHKDGTEGVTKNTLPTGGGGRHENRQPYIALNFVIRGK